MVPHSQVPWDRLKILVSAVQSRPCPPLFSSNCPLRNSLRLSLCPDLCPTQAHSGAEAGLAFKAFLLFRGEVIPTSGKAGHDIVELQRQCATLGLRLKEDADSLPTIVTMLATENEHHGFRYFDPVKGNNGVIPALPWTCDVVNALIEVIREQLGVTTPVGPAKVQFIAGKPCFS
jgi:hypothetical protein